jgi:TolB-like protein
MYFAKEITVSKKTLTEIALLLTLGSVLYAQTRLTLPNDPNAVAKQGQAEIIINAENTDKDIAVWVDGVIVAHVFPKTREKIIVNNGNYRIEAADTTLSRGNWNTGSKKQITVNANSSLIVIGLTMRYGSLISLTIQSTTPLASGGAVTPTASQPAAPVSQPSASAGDGTQAFSLETAVNRAAQKMIDNIPSGATVAVISIATNDLEVAEFVLGEIPYLLVEAKKFKVVDRNSLDKVRAEQGFQISGDVDDNTAISMGKMLGASIVMTGSVSGSGATRRLRVQALDVQTAEILASASERY